MNLPKLELGLFKFMSFELILSIMFFVHLQAMDQFIFIKGLNKLKLISSSAC